MWYNTRHSGCIMGISTSNQSITLSELSASAVGMENRTATRKKNMSSDCVPVFCKNGSMIVRKPELQVLQQKMS